MANDIESLDYFGVYEDVGLDKLTPDETAAIIGTRWVLRTSGDDIRCRLVVQDLQSLCDIDSDDMRAPTLY